MYATFEFKEIESCHKLGKTSFPVSDGKPGLDKTKSLNIDTIISFARGLPKIINTINFEWELFLWLDNYNGKNDRRLLYYDCATRQTTLFESEFTEVLREIEALLREHADEGYTDKIFITQDNETKELNNVF